MSVYFCNPGEFELDVIRVMGVNVKLGDSPLGYFGTGLKYAISTLLRTGHKVTLFCNGETHFFTTKTGNVRGKEFQFIYMNDEKLPFTTELGKNWKVWQAYRELHSNTLDEGGFITDKKASDDIVFVVEGDEIQRAFDDRSKIFLESKPLHKVDNVEVHQGKTSRVYFRGVWAGDLPDESNYTYNITGGTTLTEDRNFKSLFEVTWELERDLPQINDYHLQELNILSGFESTLNYKDLGVSESFLDAVQNNQSAKNINQSALRILRTNREETLRYEPCEIDSYERSIFRDALRLLKPLKCDLGVEEVIFTESLSGCYGCYVPKYDQIYISRQTLENGVNFLAATLYEEWLHKKHKLDDESRGMQQFLFDKIISLADRQLRMGSQ